MNESDCKCHHGNVAHKCEICFAGGPISFEIGTPYAKSETVGPVHCDNCGHVHLPSHTWTAQAPGVCLPNEWAESDDDVPTIPRISVREPDEG